MTYDTKNHHLVAIDNSRKGHVAAVFPPRSSLTKEQALMFAAWLVTTADAAEGVPLDHTGFAQRVAKHRADYVDEPTAQSVYLDTAGGVTMKPATFHTLESARELAARTVSLALNGSDLAPFFERVAAVHASVRSGAALDDALKDERTLPVDLKSPVKRIDAPASAPRPALYAHDEEPQTDEAQTDAGKRRTVPKS